MSASIQRSSQAGRANNFLPQDTIELREASRAVYVRVAGSGSNAYATTIIEYLERAVARGGKVHVYCDFWEMESYESGLREQLQTWFRNNMFNWDELHVLVRSPLVAAGVQIANVVLKGRINSVRNISDLQTRARAQGIDI